MEVFRRSKEIVLDKALLQESYDLVKAYLTAFEINPSYMDDAIQDIMIEVMTGIRSLRDPEKYKYWLLVIAKRVGIKYVSLSKSTNECSIEEFAEKGRDLTATEENQLYGCMSRLEKEEFAKLMNETLSAKEKKVIILHYIYKHKLKDIAKMIGETNTNTRTISARAMKKLKAKLEEGGYYER